MKNGKNMIVGVEDTTAVVHKNLKTRRAAHPLKSPRETPKFWSLKTGAPVFLLKRKYQPFLDKISDS